MPVGLDLHDDDTLPRYVRAVQGLDTSWKMRGRCKRYGSGAQAVWFLEAKHPGLKDRPGLPRITGNVLAEIALGECSRCPVQWQCVFYATEGEQDFGIWGVRSTDRKFLRRWFPTTWPEHLARAQDQGESVQKMMVRLRSTRRGAKSA